MAAEPDHAAVGEGDVERAALQFRAELQRQPDSLVSSGNAASTVSDVTKLGCGEGD
jgi:hypothetical protein